VVLDDIIIAELEETKGSHGFAPFIMRYKIREQTLGPPDQ